MSENLEIYLNSKSARLKQDDQTGNCFFTLPNIDIDENKEQVYVSIRNATIPFSWYNVNSTNNILNLTIDGSSYSITLIEGNYNVNTLAIEFKAQIDDIQFQHGHDGNLTITYLVKTNKFYFFHSHHDFSFLSTSTCFELLGFEDGKTYLSTLLPLQQQKEELTSTIGVNLFVVRQIYITSDNFILNNINAATPTNANIIASVPVLGNPNSVINYENTSAKHLIHHLNNINNLHIRLEDQKGQLLLLNGVNWSITLELTIIKKALLSK
tara:strand:+ start:230 stop:1033 length:804 start_codon:yes stop_codon:yes gene_type:complete